MSRTRDLLNAIQALYQLSYTPIYVSGFYPLKPPPSEGVLSRIGLPKKICVAKIFWEEERQVEEGCETPSGGSLKIPLCRDEVVDLRRVAPLAARPG